MSRKQLNNHVYVLLGDGECNEGLVWESIMSAANYGLSNITFIIDRNRMQSDGLVDEIMKTDDLADKMKAFGCVVRPIGVPSVSAINYLLKPINSPPLR